LAERRGITTGQVALAWLLQQPFPVIPLIGTTNLSHLNEALKAADVPLADDELAWLEGRTTGNTS
jgi:aryl-alcohol dehydrogenase-like predicted oxidoreductase